MEIKINKEWIIHSSRNSLNVILAKIPENLRDSLEPIDPLKLSNKRYYSTIRGAVQALFKYGVSNSDAKSFAEAESIIERIASDCHKAFSEESLKVLRDEKVQELQAEIAALKEQLKKKVA